MIQRFWLSLPFFVEGRAGRRFITSLVLLVFIVLSLPALASAQQTCQPDGDVDQNGSVTAADALLAFQHALSLVQLDTHEQNIADVFPQPAEPDGNITAADALCIFQKALSLPSCLDTPQPPADPDPLELPLRAIHASGNWGTNRDVVANWNDRGRRGPLVPPSYVEFLTSLHVNWVGLSVALHYDDSMDSTVERVHENVLTPTFTDEARRQIIRDLRAAGFGVYLTLAFEASEAEDAARPLNRWDLGDPGHLDTGVPFVDPETIGRILPENWPSRPDHPDHQRFVTEFWQTYTDQAVHFARIAEEEGDACFRSEPKPTGFSVLVRAANGPITSGRNCKPWYVVCVRSTAAS